MGNKFMQYFSLTLVVIGAINWGLIGFFDINLVALLFGSMSWLSRIVYALVGLCGLYLLNFYSPWLPQKARKAEKNKSF